MTARLVALVMLPLTLTGVPAASVLLSHRSAAAEATAIAQRVGHLSLLVSLSDALHAQSSVAAFDARFLEAGTTESEAVEFIGFDWNRQVAGLRGQAAVAVASLGDDSPVSVGTLDSLYAAIDTGAISPAEAARQISAHAHAVGSTLTDGLDQLKRDQQDTQLLAAVESLGVASSLLDVVTPQVIDLTAVWFPSPEDGPQQATALVSRLSAEHAAYHAGLDRLRQLHVPGVITAIDGIEADPRVQVFDEAVEASLRGEQFTENGAPVDPARIGAVFHGHLELDQLLDGIVSSTTEAVQVEARHIAAAERESFVLWTLGVVGLTLTSIALALRLARSISKPLKDLANYAHAVNDGNLDIEPASTHDHGPHETRVALSVFFDLVTNLQLLDAKANALAHCDFDDPVLSEPMPGRLGRSLDSSVALLSGSIVERDELQTHLAHEATHDSLTGICNRPAAITAVQAAMDRAVRTGATTALLFVDLNEFKAVNDSHGHRVGDEVLRRVAMRLVLGLRSGDVVARLGGDEFVIITEAVGGAADATDMARRIIESIGEPFLIDNLHISLGAAVGIALSLDGPEEPLRLLARADAAMYRAKHHERSALEIFDTDLQHQMVVREDVETALTAALREPGGGGLRLHYQPVLDTVSGELVGAEALIRWDRPGHGLLAPDSFIPIAEETPLIIEVDRWVLAEATRQLMAWSGVAELEDIPVSVNISGRHLLSRHLPGNIRAILDVSGIDPSRLTIEITETVLLTDLVSAAAELDAVRALGVKVAIDDFGTGYTSLAHLQQLPIDTIKIDRSFVSQLNERRGSALVRMVTDLGHAIDISIVAEGVETDAEMSALRAMGADQLQGFLLSEPLAPAAFLLWAHERLSPATAHDIEGDHR